MFPPCIQPPCIQAVDTSMETRWHHCTKELRVGCEVMHMSCNARLILNLEYAVVLLVKDSCHFVQLNGEDNGTSERLNLLPHKCDDYSDNMILRYAGSTNLLLKDSSNSISALFHDGDMNVRIQGLTYISIYFR
jgi:hypothetical protein